MKDMPKPCLVDMEGSGFACLLKEVTGIATEREGMLTRSALPIGGVTRGHMRGPSKDTLSYTYYTDPT